MELTADFSAKIEKDFLLLLVACLQLGIFDVNAAKERTREFLTLFSGMSVEELEVKLRGFTDKYKEFTTLSINMLKYKDEEQTTNLLSKMRANLAR